MKYLIIALLSVTMLNAQDTLKTELVYKNALGISLNQAITGQIASPDAYYQYVPIFASSFYIEYIRAFHKRFWLNAGIGVFNTGYRETLDGTTYNYNDYNLSIHLKPQLMILNTNKVFFYMGLSGQFNAYLTSFTLSSPEGQNLNIFESDRELKRYDIMPAVNIYGGVISGIGLKFGRIMIIAEPEFKVNMNALVGESYYNTYNLFPYAVGINLKGFLKF